jgi:hypothetical protein
MQRMRTDGLRYMNVNEQISEVEISFRRLRGNALVPNPKASRAFGHETKQMAAHCVRAQWNVRFVYNNTCQVVPCRRSVLRRLL